VAKLEVEHTGKVKPRIKKEDEHRRETDQAQV
jgi:hypothetical protein